MDKGDFKVIRPGVYEPAGYEVPSRPIDDARFSELVEQILSADVDSETDEPVCSKPAAANESRT